MSAGPRGALIVFEGLDRAGKSTQCAQLVESMQAVGQNVVHMRFPDRTTPIGQMIDAYLKGQSDQEDHVIHLLFSANRWEAAKKIETAIQGGLHVVIDRYYYSGAVYSAAKNNPQLSLDWARKPDEGLPRPDICIFLDIAPEEAAKRGLYGEEKYEKKEIQDRVRKLFTVMQQASEKDDFAIVDGGRPLEEVRTDVTAIAWSTVQRVSRDQIPLRRIVPW